MTPELSVSGGSSDLRSREQLSQLFGRKPPVAFVGAGASADVYGTWNEVLKYLIGEAVERGVASEEQRAFWLEHGDRRPQQIARAIKRALGAPRVFEDILGQYFGRRSHPETRSAFTPLHKAIVELPFKGIVTTNYDPGLLEALRCCRPGTCPVPYSTWMDEYHVNAWYSGDEFEEGTCPLLYAHGSWDRPETIILDNDRYREAYRDGPYYRMFQHLWAAERLVIIGFGFSDSWMDRLLDDILTHMVHGGGMRHFALLGIHEGDQGQRMQIRDLMQDAYNASVLFYPVRRRMVEGREVEDHGELISLLQDVRSRVESERLRLA
jgi:hypothetical protein